MIAHKYGREYTSYYLGKISFLSRQGTSLLSLGHAAEKIGFKALVGQLSYKFLVEKASLPCILYWDKNHFVVLYQIKRKRRPFSKKEETSFYIADPGVGKVRLKEDVFRNYWLGEARKGYGLFLETTPLFYSFDGNADDKKPTLRSAFRFLSTYFLRYRGNYLQVVFAMLVTAFVSLLLPFLTQGIVDIGIQKKDINFIVLIVSFQIVLFLSNTFTEIIRSQLLLHISARVNISILTDFLLKLMRLPIPFFESKMAGDLMQRVSDHQRIDKFITTALLATFFSIVNLIIFLVVLASYKISIVLIFLLGSTLSVGYTLFFLNWRKSIDYKRFRELANSGDKLFELVNGMPEIKLNNFERYKQWEWQQIQVQLFKLNLSNLKLDQYQKIGSDLVDQLKNVLITFVAAYSVIMGQMTFGMMLAISYVLGQLNVPLKQLVEFISTFQLTKIAIERMNEVYMEDDEEKEAGVPPAMIISDMRKPEKGIEIKNVSFQYGGPGSDHALKDISFFIPEGKVTAIVGSSGSGKTTLLKLLLKFYPVTGGAIYFNGVNLENISPADWRKQCGTVMQDGYIFSDTIKRNIVLGDERENIEKIVEAAEIANIGDLIADFPLNFETRIGASGIGISAGQKQRLLIARAVYKNPNIFFFDEATSALDAKNERMIMKNLHKFYAGKTVVIVAHRLSTVKNADQIIVIEKGELMEIGDHVDLVSRQGAYYSLVKNQLELGV
jgi:ATP-binding cassette, subfamily B, bacterial